LKQDPEPSAKRLQRPKPATYFFYFLLLPLLTSFLETTKQLLQVFNINLELSNIQEQANLIAIGMHGYWLIGTIANKYDLVSRNLLFFTIFILDSTMDKNAVAASTKNVMANVKYVRAFTFI
jgi:hypothetical protein